MDPSAEPTDELVHLYPGLDEAERQQAGENLTRYLELVLRIFERIQADPEAYERFRSLTRRGSKGTMTAERSDPASDGNLQANL